MSKFHKITSVLSSPEKNNISNSFRCFLDWNLDSFFGGGVDFFFFLCISLSSKTTSSLFCGKLP